MKLKFNTFGQSATRQNCGWGYKSCSARVNANTMQVDEAQRACAWLFLTWTRSKGPFPRCFCCQPTIAVKSFVIPLKAHLCQGCSIRSLSQCSLLSFNVLFISLLEEIWQWCVSDVFLKLMKLTRYSNDPSPPGEEKGKGGRRSERVACQCVFAHTCSGQMINDTIVQGLEDWKSKWQCLHLHVLYVCLHVWCMEMEISVELQGFIWRLDEWWEPGLSASIQGCVHHLWGVDGL